MAPTHTQLRQLIRALLREGAPPEPDEPSVAPDDALGRYVFPSDRVNAHAYHDVREADTQLEADFFHALDRHYNANNPGPLRALWPQLIELEKQGLYSSVLRPPAGKVYRLMTLAPARAALFLGLEEAEVATSVGEAQSAPSPPPYRAREFLSSWTLDPEGMVDVTGGDFVNAKPGGCSLLFVADTRSADFLMNPVEFARGWKVGRDYAHEQEVIGGGEIPIEAAAWMWHGDPEKVSPRVEVDNVIRTAYKSLYRKEEDLRMRDPEGDPETVRPREFELWSKFINQIVWPIKVEIPDSVKFETMGGGIIRRLLSVTADQDAFESFADGRTDPAWMDEAANEVMTELAAALDEHLDYDVSKPKLRMPTHKVLERLLAAVR